MNKIIKEILRYLVMKRLTGNLGKVVDTEDKIICYINKRNSKRECLTDYFYCRGINKSNKVLANIYNLNKPITYVFNDRYFKKHDVVIYGYDNANIVIIILIINIVANPFIELSPNINRTTATIIVVKLESIILLKDNLSPISIIFLLIGVIR